MRVLWWFDWLNHCTVREILYPLCPAKLFNQISSVHLQRKRSVEKSSLCFVIMYQNQIQLCATPLDVSILPLSLTFHSVFSSLFLCRIISLSSPFFLLLPSVTSASYTAKGSVPNAHRIHLQFLVNHFLTLNLRFHIMIIHLNKLLLSPSLQMIVSVIWVMHA